MGEAYKLVQCTWKRLGKRGRRCNHMMPLNRAKQMLAGPTGHKHVVPICDFHWQAVDTASRIRFWRRRKGPTISTVRVDADVDVYGIYNIMENDIEVTQHFAEMLSPEQQVYVLSHETLHWFLSREFGLMSSVGLDILYQRPLQCLGWHSLHTLMLDLIYRQTEALNSPNA